MPAHLADFCLLPGWRPSKFVEADLKPLVYAFVQRMILIAYLLAGKILFQGLQNKLDEIMPCCWRQMDSLQAKDNTK